MSRRAIVGIAIGCFVATAGSEAVRSDPDLPEYIVPPTAASPARSPVGPGLPITVLAMASDGSWGVATSPSIGEAITGAMADCRWMSGPKLGCGHMSKAARGEWLLGVRCGSDNIIVAHKILANAELAAFNRETELRQVYRKVMPACARIVTVDPDGYVGGSRTRVAKPKLH